MNDIPEDLRKRIVEEVEEGFDDRDEIIETVLEHAADEGHDVTAEEIAAVVDLELFRHDERQAEWEVPTDCDRIDAAFDALEDQGLVARQHFT